ncbi:MAG: hypothetical protein ACTSXW_08825 [Candidatus Baldrarchaeia archaeon]
MKKVVSISWLMYFLFASINHYIGLLPFITPEMEKILWITAVVSFPIFAISLIKLFEKEGEKETIVVTEKPLDLVIPEIEISEDNVEIVNALRREYEQKILHLQQRIKELEEKLKYYETRGPSVVTPQVTPVKTKTVKSLIKEEVILTDLKSEQLAVKELLTRLDEQFKSGKISESAYRQMKRKYEERLKEINEKLKEVKK